MTAIPDPLISSTDSNGNRPKGLIPTCDSCDQSVKSVWWGSDYSDPDKPVGREYGSCEGDQCNPVIPDGIGGYVQTPGRVVSITWKQPKPDPQRSIYDGDDN